MAETMATFQWTVDEIEKCLLLNWNNDSETNKEIKMRDIQEKEEIKTIIKKMDEVKSEMNQVSAVRLSYASTVQQDNQFKIKFRRERDRKENREPVGIATNWDM